MNGLSQKVYDFVDERIDLKTLEAKMMNEPIKGGSRWAYIFGSCLLFIFIMQAITGMLLMFYYIPSADHAYASTQFIIHEVDYGWFILSYHFWGSSAMVVMVFAHMSQVFLWGAYKNPREMIWLVGLVLFVIVMAFGFTGYLLPWDQRAYWATTVGVEIMDKTPIVGDFLARFLKGGPTPGQMTLSRFFVIHVMILPAALMGLAGLHLFLFRSAGPAGPFRGTPEELKAKTDFFFPRQVWKDIVAIAVVFLTICSLAFIEPVQLLEQATPDPGDYHPEPEWYFLFLFQMLRLKVFSGEVGQFVAGVAIPGAFMLLLAALPFIDRSPERNIFKRPLALLSWAVGLTARTVFLERLGMEVKGPVGVSLWWQGAVLGALVLGSGYYAVGTTVAVGQKIAAAIIALIKKVYPKLPIAEQITLELLLWTIPTAIVLLMVVLLWLQLFGWRVKRFVVTSGQTSSASFLERVRQWDYARVPADPTLMLVSFAGVIVILTVVFWVLLPVTTPTPHPDYPLPQVEKVKKPVKPEELIKKTESTLEKAAAVLTALEKEKSKEMKKGKGK